MYFYSKTFTYICKTKLKDMTKEELTVKIWQKSRGQYIRASARQAIEQNTEAAFIDKLIKNMVDNDGVEDWYIFAFGEDLYNELQKFKTEK